ncbi:cupin domain-containing protein [Phormidium sp. CLA17]|uniref:cupin domain-containing protein n=1 Tax=Leptolyngbya sp. Cla-17 TaxID=2803751 RepID=UPI0014924BC6|nr:cupin domain-containing protein [Leptolyngbya sp. Cla-17]MBM0740337.1 cupin domain-containing protein [Leptolyngbya sp. Cla-17]
MNLDKDIVTVRPEMTINTLQKLPNYVGISALTAGAKGISMNMVVIPPGAKAEPHFHQGFETAIYLLKGKVETLYGENLTKSIVNEEGDFIFIPAGVPHQPRNLSDSESALAIVSRNDPNEQESVQIYSPNKNDPG